jgi:hypothetical protein
MTLCMSDTVTNNHVSQPSHTAVMFVYKDIYLVDLREVISVQPNPVRDQVAIQMRHGAYTVWHDVDDATEAAKQLIAAKLDLSGVEYVEYEPAKRVRS